MDLQPLLDHSVNPLRPLVVAGPCSAETHRQTLEAARRLAALPAEVRPDVFRAGIWKPRTHPGGFEGIGGVGLSWLAEVKAETGLATATEVATRAHVEAALRAGVDILWIGARTTANPFAVQEIADALAAMGSDAAVLVKNPVNPDIELWIGALERLHLAGIRRLGAVHRGFTVYGEKQYRNSPQWQIPIELHMRIPGMPLLHDPSHTSGRAAGVLPLVGKALHLGFDGIMAECHPDPQAAWSDAAQQLTPEAFGEGLAGILAGLKGGGAGMVETSGQDRMEDTLGVLRCRIDDIDNQLLSLLADRMDISRKIGKLKQSSGLTVMQPDRFNSLLADRMAKGEAQGLSPQFTEALMATIHNESIKVQCP